MSAPETPESSESPERNPAPAVHPIRNLDSLTYQPFGNGGAFAAQIADIGWTIGAVKLGYNVTVVPPGKAAFPFHSHTVNEEMFVILSGTGELRLGDRCYPLRSGDVVACPPGGRETAHQIRNTGDTDLRYLAIATAQYPDIAEYPDSGKFAVVHRVPGPPGTPSDRVFRHVGRPEQAVDYWDGEEGEARPA